MTNKSFDMLLDLLIKAMPRGIKIPGSHYEARSYLRALGLGYESLFMHTNMIVLCFERKIQT